MGRTVSESASLRITTGMLVAGSVISPRIFISTSIVVPPAACPVIRRNFRPCKAFAPLPNLARLLKKSAMPMPRGLKSARDEKNKQHGRWPKGQHYPKSLFPAACKAVAFQNPTNATSFTPCLAGHFAQQAVRESLRHQYGNVLARSWFGTLL